MIDRLRAILDRLGAGGLPAGPGPILSPSGRVSLINVDVSQAPPRPVGAAKEEERRAFLAAEYGECRAAIARFDGILTDLRTKGLAAVLAFNGVSAVVAQTGP